MKSLELVHGNDATGDYALVREEKTLVIRRVYSWSEEGIKPFFLALTSLAEGESTSMPKAWAVPHSEAKWWNGVEWKQGWHPDFVPAGEVVARLEESRKSYWPAKVGDVFRPLNGSGPELRVGEEDLARGYLEAGSYMGVRSGRLIHPVFLVPRVFYLHGNAEEASRSVFKIKED